MKFTTRQIIRICAGLVIFEAAALLLFTKYSNSLTFVILLVASLVMLNYSSLKIDAGIKLEILSILFAALLVIFAIASIVLTQHPDKAPEITTMAKCIGAAIMIIAPIFYIWKARQIINKNNLL